MQKKQIDFEFKVKNKRYSSESFKIYVVSVNSCDYPDVKPNSKGEYIITGDIPELAFDVKYMAKAEIETNPKFGIQYKILKVRRNKPNDIDKSRAFLLEIISENQANTLLETYPNIIDMIINNEEVDLSKLKGIKEFTFGNIKEKVIENFVLIDLVDEFGGVLSFQVMKKLYNKYTCVERVKEELNKNPYRCLCSLNRIGFKIADKIILDLEKENKLKPSNSENILCSKFRMRASIIYVLEENESSGNTIMPIAKLRTECDKLTKECMKYFLECIKEYEDKDFKLFKEDKTIGLYQTIMVEKYIADKIDKLLLQENDYGINVEIYRDKDEVSLTDEQIVSLNNLSKHSISLLTAPAGAGKSMTISNIITMLEDNDKTYMLMSPTGKAAKILADYANRKAGTIHRQLGFNPEKGWGFNEENKLDVDVVVVDEATMVDIWLMKALLSAIDTKRTKLLLVFDSYQLPSVSAGNVAQDLLNNPHIPKAILTKIFRYGEGGLMNVATKIRNSEKFLDNNFTGNKVFGLKKDFVYMEVQQMAIRENVLKIYNKLLKDGYSLDDIMIVTSQNKGDYGTKEVNKYVQAYLQKDKNTYIQSGETKFFKGDKVMQILNNYEAKSINGEKDEVFNGNTGVIRDISFGEVIVDYGDDKVVCYSKDELKQLDLAYCTTIHKQQGSSSNQVIVIAPKAHTFMLNSNLLYVAPTRAKQRVWMIGNIITINRAIKKKENLTRMTSLNKFLK